MTLREGGFDRDLVLLELGGKEGGERRHYRPVDLVITAVQ
jgi:hypothetical protein